MQPPQLSSDTVIKIKTVESAGVADSGVRVSLIVHGGVAAAARPRLVCPQVVAQQWLKGAFTVRRGAVLRRVQLARGVFGVGCSLPSVHVLLVHGCSRVIPRVAHHHMRTRYHQFV